MTVMSDVLARRKARTNKSFYTPEDHRECECDLTIVLAMMYDNPLRVRAEVREEVQLEFDLHHAMN